VNGEEEAYRHAVVDIIIRHLELMVEEIQGVARKYEPKDTLPSQSTPAPTATTTTPSAEEPWKPMKNGKGDCIRLTQIVNPDLRVKLGTPKSEFKTEAYTYRSWMSSDGRTVMVSRYRKRA
jgi:hypothetical protein